MNKPKENRIKLNKTFARRAATEMDLDECLITTEDRKKKREKLTLFVGH